MSWILGVDNGYKLFMRIKSHVDCGCIYKIIYEVTHFNYARESQDGDEMYYFCKIGDFLIENKLYQAYFNYLSTFIKYNSRIVREHINDENAYKRLKQFENLVLSKSECFAFESYNLLYDNLTINLHAKSKVKTPEMIKSEYYGLYKENLILFPII
jgi:hypothetical protein